MRHRCMNGMPAVVQVLLFFVKTILKNAIRLSHKNWSHCQLCTHALCVLLSFCRNDFFWALLPWNGEWTVSLQTIYRKLFFFCRSQVLPNQKSSISVLKRHSTSNPHFCVNTRLFIWSPPQLSKCYKTVFVYFLQAVCILANDAWLGADQPTRKKRHRRERSFQIEVMLMRLFVFLSILDHVACFQTEVSSIRFL